MPTSKFPVDTLAGALVALGLTALISVLIGAVMAEMIVRVIYFLEPMETDQ